ncbi:hypothetical protein EDD27_3527 [Nonomuraea polychroma]|uniref:Zinc-binding alcohol dehydrogenase family protein n=1 Tax=Nonomuraea polychroma TaxID=46176 RepID=A0A438M5D7_9ACTN|nr:hypothetical protein [Nonomuraea polychroma]RVX41066.1 hypothetical protein EDD27_3527 [Nonomuraea polychroma]
MGACADRPELPFWPLLFANVKVRLLGSDDFPLQAKQHAACDLAAAAAVGALKVPIGDRFPLEEIAKSRERVDVGGRGRVLVTIPEWTPPRCSTAIFPERTHNRQRAMAHGE